MSPRAAARLEALGFAGLFDYVAGQGDWGSFGLPLGGRRPSSSLVAHTSGAMSPPALPLIGCLRCASVSAPKAGTRASSRTRPRVVVGRLGRAAMAGNDDVSVEEAMSLGPSTVLPSLELEKAVERRRNQNLTCLPVTRSDGVLVGVLRREDAARAWAASEET
jgi:hypothetical protein